MGSCFAITELLEVLYISGWVFIGQTTGKGREGKRLTVSPRLWETQCLEIFFSLLSQGLRRNLGYYRPCCCYSVTKSCLFVTPHTEICQAPLSSIIFWSLLKFLSFESVMLLAILSSATLFSFCLQSFPAVGFFPTSWFFTFRRLNYWSINPSNGYSGLISFRIDGTVPACMLSHFNCA